MNSKEEKNEYGATGSPVDKKVENDNGATGAPTEEKDGGISNASEKPSYTVVIRGNEFSSSKQYVLNEETINKSKRNKFEILDDEINDENRIRAQSEAGYHQLAVKIVDITQDYIDKQYKHKEPIRTQFVSFFKDFLLLQYLVLVMLFVFDSFDFVPFSISEELLETYIISVFVETLAVIGVMIAFAFSTKEESTIVKVLTSVIESYQKYKGSDEHKNDKK